MYVQLNLLKLVVAGGVISGVLGMGVAHADPFSGQQVTLEQELPAAAESAGSDVAAAVTVPDGANSASPQSASDQEYRVKSGDTLCEIAKRLLGDPRRYMEIVRLNAARYPSLVKNPNLILVGWALRLPGADDADTPAAGRASAAAATSAATPSASSAASGEPVTGLRPATQAAAPTPTVAPTPAAADVSTTGTPLIGPGQRVLHIGDSHTVGIYGSTIDESMRGTGAQVRTCGVAGSSPSWWYQGTVTKCGYYSRDEKGKTDRPADWRTPRATPSLPEMIREYKPTVLVVSLGANLFGASEATVRRETQRIIDTAAAAGCTLVWVGPPRARETVKSIAAQDRLCETIKATVGTQGTFVDSRPYTKYPTNGGDGLHYWGTEGSRTAKNWAGSVLNAIQTSGKSR